MGMIADQLAANLAAMRKRSDELDAMHAEAAAEAARLMAEADELVALAERC